MKKLALLTLFVVFSTHTLAQSPHTPTINPNPPKSASDKKTVGFVESIIHTLLETRLSDAVWEFSPDAVSNYHEKKASCLKDETCWMQDGKFTKDLQNIQDAFGLLTEYRFPHLVTNIKTSGKSAPLTDDEKLQAMVDKEQKSTDYSSSRVVRVFARFTNVDGWYKVDFVLGNPKKGQSLKQIAIAGQ